MTRKTLTWAVGLAFVVGIAAMITAGVFENRQRDGLAPVKEQVASENAGSGAGVQADSDAAGISVATGPETVVSSEPQDTQPPKSNDGQGAADAGNAEPDLRFDVVGVEPTGDTVVAGRSDAGAIVALTANGEVVGKTIANARGEWTIVLDQPLAPGNYDVGLSVLNEDGQTKSESPQRVVVSVPEDGKEQPLVVLNAPEQPSNILQMPAGQRVADASAVAGETPTGSEQTAAGQQTGDVSAASADTQPGGITQAGGQSLSETAGRATGSATDAQTDAAASAETEGTPTSDSERDTPSVTVEAVETEAGKMYVAGTGEPGTSVNVYVGDEFAGQANVSGSGRWLLEEDREVGAGNVEIRVDLVEKGTDNVEARAAVTFAKEADQQIILTKVSASGAAGDGHHADTVENPLPMVIIREGDHLWKISRRLYGSGVRYTTIYQANQHQIRNPDLIYPGQVFLTPHGDLGWEAVPAQ
ncbi:LysM peptidoglycan-binding domain-containing protein [Roseibium sp. RKSG952]|uniref:LysM peptidoglycan-binding domain-containing protein n=1 Tax=Roseibium sp. RKSG952 TaxID=2529384 RepID=UPI0012BCFEC1|nr:LysM peptidoglycan-binding domain-containing protein [Roseibium sp. RKSG952]MTI00349.1 LysM peptidoglycan-binding domain-containing protein [Roseibium sp. RKSG952]